MCGSQHRRAASGPRADPRRCGEKTRKGGKWSKRLRKYLGDPSFLHIVILPYEEPGLPRERAPKNCSVSFVCEHPETGEIDMIPFCAYFVHKNESCARARRAGRRRKPPPEAARPWNWARLIAA